MGLQALLRDVDPGWYAAADGGAPDDATFAPQLLARAQDSALGRRLLARCLIDAGISHLLAPTADGSVGAVARRWPRTRLALLLRDLGTLAFAPAIRAEVRRTPVRRLKHALGKNYLLALDAGIWDGKVDKTVAARLTDALDAALDAVEDDAADGALFALFERKGRDELLAWAGTHDPALAEWIALQRPRAAPGTAHLPPEPLQFLLEHHQSRAG